MSVLNALMELLPGVFVGVIVFGIFEVIARRTDLLRDLESESTNRLSTLDGLRAFLSFGVVACHVGTFYYLLKGQPWGNHPNPYYREAGAASVRLFFMITGFLFWSRAIRDPIKLRARTLFVNRFFRVMPLYFGICIVILVLSITHSNAEFQDSAGSLLRQIGLLLVPGLKTDGTINGFEYTEYLRQAWTLKWELFYYLCLPLIAAFAGSPIRFSILSVLAIAFTLLAHRYLTSQADLSITVNFLVGMATAHLVDRFPSFPWAKSKMSSLALFVIFLIAPIVTVNISNYIGNLLYVALFILAVYGGSGFGILTLKSSRILGEVSYSTYLLHMLVLVPSSGFIAHNLPSTLFNENVYWVAMLPTTIAIYGLSILTFRYVERPAITFARRLAVRS